MIEIMYGAVIVLLSINIGLKIATIVLQTKTERIRRNTREELCSDYHSDPDTYIDY